MQNDRPHDARAALTGFIRAATALLLILAASGCRPAPHTAVAGSRVFVRLPALVPLHPAWSDVRQIDQLIAFSAKMSAGATPMLPPAVTLPESAVPTALSPPSVPPAGPPPTVDIVTEPARARLQRLGAILTARIDREIDRQRESRLRRVNADVAIKRADLESRPQPDYVGLPEVDRIRLRNLRMKQIALDNQVSTLFPPARGDAEKKLDVVNSQIKELEARVPSQPQAIRQKVDQEVATYRAGLVAQVESELKSRRASLEKDRAASLQSYAASIPSDLPVIAPIGTDIPIPTGPIPMPSIPSARIAAASARVAPTAAIDTAPSRAAMRAQRERLISVIQDDEKRRLELAAAARGWALSFAPASGASDVTDQARAVLIQEYGPHTGR